MTIMYGWPYLLQKEIKKSSRMIIIDQGPVYLLAEMREFGPEYLRADTAESFWQNLYGRWAGSLDTIIWLEAPDPVLLDRIRTREEDHVVKHETDSKMLDFLERYRKAYKFTVSALVAFNPDMRILKFDTSKQSAKEIVNSLVEEIGLA
jgi:hypothetical protein